MSNLYVIGIGPGDPELLTLKAVRVIKEVPVLFVPKGREDGESLALSIVNKAIDLKGKEIRELHFPMVKTRDQSSKGQIAQRWDAIFQALINVLRDRDVAFLTLGDPCLYSTFFYLYERLNHMPQLKIEIIPGVSSINASAAKAGIYLGLANERIAIVPANYEGFSESIIDDFDTIVFMKVDRVWQSLKDFLDKHGLLKNSIYISRVGMEEERIIRDIDLVKEEDLNYFSIAITTTRLKRESGRFEAQGLTREKRNG